MSAVEGLNIGQICDRLPTFNLNERRDAWRALMQWFATIPADSNGVRYVSEPVYKAITELRGEFEP